jgi:hypothetical protein
MNAYLNELPYYMLYHYVPFYDKNDELFGYGKRKNIYKIKKGSRGLRIFSREVDRDTIDNVLINKIDHLILDQIFSDYYMLYWFPKSKEPEKIHKFTHLRDLYMYKIHKDQRERRVPNFFKKIITPFTVTIIKIRKQPDKIVKEGVINVEHGFNELHKNVTDPKFIVAYRHKFRRVLSNLSNIRQVRNIFDLLANKENRSNIFYVIRNRTDRFDNSSKFNNTKYEYNATFVNNDNNNLKGFMTEIQKQNFKHFESPFNYIKYDSNINKSNRIFSLSRSRKTYTK